MTPCADSRLISLLARGDLDPAEDARLRAHLTSCPTCSGELAAEQHLTRKLLEELPRPAAPAELKAALERIMRARHARPPPRRTRRLIAAAAAAAAALAIGGILTLRKPPVRDPQSFAQHAAAAHRTLEGQRAALPNETAGASARLSELSQRTGLPATTAFQGDGELRLVSARQGRALGKVSAVLVYLDAKERLVTLEILPGGDVTIPRERTSTVAQYHPMLTRAGQLGVAVWKQGASLYLLTAPCDERELAALYLKVRTHTS